MERPSLQLSGCMLTGVLTAPDDELYIDYDSDDPYRQDFGALEIDEFVW